MNQRKAGRLAWGAVAAFAFAATACSSNSPTSPTTGTGTSTSTDPATSFNITIRYVGNGATARQKQAVESAVTKWQSVITGDLPDITGSADANECFDGQPAINERIDDVVIYVQFDSIDGVGNILGQAGPCYIRDDDGLPIIGHLELDEADLAQMERRGTLDAVVLHEMGHILGIGTLWPLDSLLSGADTSDPRFTGAKAIAAYHILGGLESTVPVEGQGEDGTKNGHWRESVFGNELMTGFISGPTNPLSAMTVASLQDMGYDANTKLASSYSFATSTQFLVANDALVSGMDGAERLETPKFLVDRAGNKTRITGTVSNKPWYSK